MATDLESLVLSISADTTQLKRALQRTERDTKQTADNINRSFQSVDPMGRAAANFNRSTKAMANDAKVLSFQFNDLFTQISSGTSVTQAFNQQIGQIAQSFGGAGGIRGAASLAGQALLGMVPQAAIVGAFAAITYAANLYFAASEKGTKISVEDAAKQVSEIKKIADAWKDRATPALQAYLGELVKAAEKTQQIAERTELENKAFAPAKEAVAAIDGDIQSIQSKLQSLGSDDFAQQAIELGRAFDEVRKKTEANEPALKEIENLQKLIAQAQKSQIPDVVALANTITQKLVPALQQAADTSKQIQISTDFSNPITGPSRGPGGPIDMRGANYSIGAQNDANAAAEAKKRGENDAKAYMLGLEPEFKSRLKAFIAAAQSEAGSIVVNSGKRSTERQAQLWAQALQKYGSPEKARKWVAPPGRSNHEKGMAADLGYESEAVKQWAHANAEAYGLVFRLKNEDWHIELAANEARKEKKKTLDDVMLSEKQQIELQSQIAAINANTSLTEEERQFQVDKLTIATKLLNEAKAAGVTLDANALAQIDATSSALARQEQNEKSLTQAKRERTQAAVEARQATEQLVSTGLSTFVSELRAGASAADALRSALNRVLDTIIQISINAISSSIGGALFPTRHSGGPVGLGGANRRVSPLAFAGAPRMHNGGVAGLMPNEIPTILRRGEIVLPSAKALAKGGTIDNRKTYLGGVEINMSGVVAAGNEQAREWGLRVQKIIQAEIVRERRPGGLLRT